MHTRTHARMHARTAEDATMTRLGILCHPSHMRGTQATTLLFSKEQGSVSSFTPDSIKTMEILFLLLGFLFFVKGCTGHTLYGEVGGTVVFQCHSTKKEIKYFYFQGGTDFKKVIIGYLKTKKHNEPSRPDTYLNHENKTVTFGKLTVSDEGSYKCIISHGDPGGMTEDTTISLSISATPDAVTLEHHNPQIAGEVSNASLTCTAIAAYPVSKISWNDPSVHKHPSEDRVTKDNNSLLFNISSTASFNCSDGSTQLIICSLGGVSSDGKIVCQQPKGECNLGTEANRDSSGRLSFSDLMGVKKSIQCAKYPSIFRGVPIPRLLRNTDLNYLNMQ
ncbi:uncharacterized protein LOC132455269 isoform X2 [Gadus macrocephalus]|uniref:uncharacterized protein LOC132455269 isoform X2 n=1 Tax=Gadus macrocephalus TaxID=80720 RepID=UPI0028CB2489|nr:uncharacterized protein LOC132455269 isoform X2 [Gadus macrocephalus]